MSYSRNDITQRCKADSIGRSFANAHANAQLARRRTADRTGVKSTGGDGFPGESHAYTPVAATIGQPARSARLFRLAFNRPSPDEPVFVAAAAATRRSHQEQQPSGAHALRLGAPPGRLAGRPAPTPARLSRSPAVRAPCPDPAEDGCSPPRS